MILFKEVYDRAINLFDDPDYRKAYVYDKIKWQKMMYKHLQNGVALFTSPVPVALALVDQTPPSGEMEIFNGSGRKTYALTGNVKEGSDIVCRIGGTIDKGAEFSFDDNTVTFSREVTESEECSVQWYYSGAFNTDFSSVTASGISADTVRYFVMEIIPRCLVSAWAENEKNFVLDIKNLLTDTDFKIYSPANSIRAKIEWTKDLKFQLDTLQNKFAWAMFSKVRRGGMTYGP